MSMVDISSPAVSWFPPLRASPVPAPRLLGTEDDCHRPDVEQLSREVIIQKSVSMPTVGGCSPVPSRPVLSWSAVLQSVEDYAEAPDGAQHVLCADGDGLHYVTSVTRTTSRRTPSCRRSASTSILRRTRRCRSVTASSCPTSSGRSPKDTVSRAPTRLSEVVCPTSRPPTISLSSRSAHTPETDLASASALAPVNCG